MVGSYVLPLSDIDERGICLVYLEEGWISLSLNGYQQTFSTELGEKNTNTFILSNGSFNS